MQKNNLVKNAEKIYKGREKIIEVFIKEILLIDCNTEGRSQIQEDKNIRNENALIDYKRLPRLIRLKHRNINELARRNFLVQDLGELLEKLKRLENNSARNKIQVSVINKGLKDFKEEIKDTSEQEKEIKNPHEIINLVENILEFNRQQQQQQQQQPGQGLKMLTPNQILSRLPISLAQLKAEKLKQLLYSLY